jgi:hypothetical protein
MGSVGNQVLDFGLDTLVIDTTAICLCVVEPVNYAMASIGAGNVMGYRVCAGDAFNEPVNATPNGQG